MLRFDLAYTRAYALSGKPRRRESNTRSSSRFGRARIRISPFSNERKRNTGTSADSALVGFESYPQSR